MRLTFTARERGEVLKAWLLLSLAFAVYLTCIRPGASGFLGCVRLDVTLLRAFGLALITAGIGFVLHELAHKWFATRYRCYAEFRANMRMLIVTLVLSPFLLVAAPGAVHISGHAGREQQGKIALAGPVTNLVLTLLFLLLRFIPQLTVVAGYGAMINSWLALFNMFPFPGFDGAKVFLWNKAAFWTTIIIASLFSLLIIPL